MRSDYCVGTLTTNSHFTSIGVYGVLEVGKNDMEQNLRIRKLTPKECWRLMDFNDRDFERAEQVNSNTQLYKQAGNSIVCNVLVAILGQLFVGKENVYKN